MQTSVNSFISFETLIVSLVERGVRRKPGHDAIPPVTQLTVTNPATCTHLLQAGKIDSHQLCVTTAKQLLNDYHASSSRKELAAVPPQPVSACWARIASVCKLGAWTAWRNSNIEHMAGSIRSVKFG
jgi:hypothetical protein